MTAGMPILVYDVGGSHVSAAACLKGGADYSLGPIANAPHPPEKTTDAFIRLLYTLGIDALSGFEGVSGAELAMPGPFDFGAGVSLMRHKLPYLYGVHLGQLLEQSFGWQAGQVRFLHDAAAFLLGEIGAGAARDFSRAVGITLGTGIGSAFAIDGRVVTEGPGVPPGGEIWNLPYEGGIVEDFISTRAIQREYKCRAGELLDVSKIAAMAETDLNAAAVFVEFGYHLGQALRMVVSEFAPQVVVLGGGISRSPQLFLPAAQGQVEDLNFSLQTSMLKNNAPLVGAAVAWFNGSNGANAPSPQATAHAARADAV
ncbi:MAG: ROK family protein [Terracidiphilus sp.]